MSSPFGNIQAAPHIFTFDGIKQIEDECDKYVMRLIAEKELYQQALFQYDTQLQRTPSQSNNTPKGQQQQHRQEQDQHYLLLKQQNDMLQMQLQQQMMMGSYGFMGAFSQPFMMQPPLLPAMPVLQPTMMQPQSFHQPPAQEIKAQPKSNNQSNNTGGKWKPPFVFFHYFRKKLRKEMPNKNGNEIMKILGERWNNMSEEQRLVWKDEADKLNAIERQQKMAAENAPNIEQAMENGEESFEPQDQEEIGENQGEVGENQVEEGLNQEVGEQQCLQQDDAEILNSLAGVESLRESKEQGYGDMEDSQPPLQLDTNAVQACEAEV